MAPLTSDLSVIALPDEMIDALVWRVLGKGAGAVERVVEANPHVVASSHGLPAGTVVIIPAEADAPVQTDLVQLWD